MSNKPVAAKTSRDHFRIAMTGGGSGGHVYPALAVLQHLQQLLQAEQPQAVLEVLWIGQKGGIEQDIIGQYEQQSGAQSEQLQIQYCDISCGKLRRYFSWQNFTDVFRIALGVWQSYWLLRHKRPCVLFSKGGFVSMPGLVAARWLKIATLAHESDLDPGLATRLTLPLVNTLFLPYEQSRKYYKAKYHHKLQVCGNPVRSEFFAASETAATTDIAQALLPQSWFDSDHNLQRPLLLVLGGSLGASELNNYVQNWLKEEDTLTRFLQMLYIFHQCGAADYEKLAAMQQKFANYRVEPFVSKGLEALYHLCRRSSGLVLSRAGAGSLWEILASGNQALVVPLQVGSRGDQLRNARLFAERGWAYNFVAEAAGQNADQQRNSRKLLEQIRIILQDNKPHSSSTAEQQPIVDAAQYIAQTIWQLILAKHA